MVAFRHGLRVSELCALTWDQIDFSQGMMHVRRIENGIGSVQQIGGDEMRMLRALKREDAATRYVAALPRAQEHHAHGALHGVEPGEVQEVLGRLRRRSLRIFGGD